MTINADSRRSSTPISDGLASDLQALGSLLGSHMRGLDEHLGRQHERLALREHQLLEESRELLPPAAVNLEALSKEELQALCRQHKLKGWSKLRRGPLIVFVESALFPSQAATEPTGPAPAAHPALNPTDASRSERLLLLLLEHLAVSPQRIAEAWEGPQQAGFGGQAGT
ncbi:hypothetical protein KBY97_03815 [Synechococcus sp. ATX 2A4]|uniref:hypothetical protein n=1 Tax=Synechococcus sp. ATX 2A4 TaxID=2823727 RepID=UPI0020CD7080|nr:hypothetical protein [Synechococcus sp. ATX 2A4]MCP9884257.1 hypothetical protein [Synechococcus sp. ATX 2A4]